MSVPALRPLRVGEILDASIKVYLSNARTLMGLTAVVVVPFQILYAIVLLSVVSSASEVPHGFTSFVSAQRTADTAATSGAKTVLLFADLIVNLLSTAACVKAISDAYLDQPVDLGSSLRFAARRLGALAWMAILMWVLLGLAFIALVIRVSGCMRRGRWRRRRFLSRASAASVRWADPANWCGGAGGRWRGC